MHKSFVAHICDDREQTVKEHLCNTARISGRFAAEIGLESTLELAGQLHDMGKLCIKFDDYIRGKNDVKRGEIDHSYAGARYILSLTDKKQRLVAEFIARVILSHHGLHDWIDEDGNDYLQKRSSKDEEYNSVQTEYELIFPREDTILLLNKSAEEFDIVTRRLFELSARNRIHCLFYMNMLERLAVSMLIDADRTDTADFMAGRKTLPKTEKYGIWSNISDGIEVLCTEFSKNKDEISVARSNISERCLAFAGHKVGICRLVVPTGGGKTLSSMRFAARYCQKNNNNRIIYTAPFMSILEQNSDILRSLTKNDDEYLEHHSNYLQETDDKEEVSFYQYHSEKWDSAVIATTLVQLLNTLFLSKSSCVRRFHRICRSVVIIDEVQSVPIRCVRMFNMAMNFLSHICNTTIVLCSATQPPFDNDDKFPLLLDKDSSMTGDYTADFDIFKRTQVVNLTRKSGYSFDETSELCYEKFLEKGNVLLIVNTKKAAEEIYKRLKEITTPSECLLLHLSTRMCPGHRRDILKKLRSALKDDKPVICVTTQLIEAGVDISFRCVIRSLAGLDNIAQAGGRCNRNGEYPCSDVYVININEEQLGQLKEIETSQKSTRELLYNKPEDIMSVDSMSQYYRILFRERHTELSYPVLDLSADTTLIDMLSCSKVRRKLNKGQLPTFTHCPKTAGELFRVIDNNTRSVIVPYNDEARELILQLTSEEHRNDITAIMRKAQKYIVELYASDEKKLSDEGALRFTEYGVAVLSEEYYNDECGVTLEAGLKEALIY